MAMQYFGVRSEDGVSDYLKATLTSEDYSVTGYIGPGASMDLTSNWTTPFADDNLGALPGLSTTANLKQATSSETSVMRWNSLMVWEGGLAPSFNLPLVFYARYNALVEVQQAIAALTAMISPQLNDTSPKGRRPYACTLNIGRRFLLADVVILNVSFDFDAPRNAEGYFIRNTVNLQLSGMAIQNRSDITSRFT